MRTCMVPFCKNRGRMPGICYFRLTRDRFHPWLAALHRKDKDVSPSCCICSEHFAPENILVKHGKAFVRPGAVPTLKLRPLDIRKHFSQKHSENQSTKEMMMALGISQVKWIGNNQSLATVNEKREYCLLSSCNEEIKQEMEFEFEEDPLYIEPSEELNAINSLSLEVNEDPLEIGVTALEAKSEPSEVETEELNAVISTSLEIKEDPLEIGVNALEVKSEPSEVVTEELNAVMSTSLEIERDPLEIGVEALEAKSEPSEVETEELNAVMSTSLEIKEDTLEIGVNALEVKSEPSEVETEELNAVKSASLEIKEEPLEIDAEALEVTSDPLEIGRTGLQNYIEHLKYCLSKDHTYSRSAIDWKIKYENLMKSRNEMALKLKNCDRKIHRLKMKIEKYKQIIKALKKAKS